MTLTLSAGRLDDFYSAVSELSGHDRTLPLAEIRLSPDALADSVDLALAESRPRVVLVQDATPILRAGEPVKPLVANMFETAGCRVEQVVVIDPHEVHTTSEHIAEVQACLQPGDAVVALGSGTIADITKHAVHGFEHAHPGRQLRLVVIQTANSVCAYTSGLAVVTTGGVKRTLPSRLPDGLLADTRLLADAPAAYTLGGIGDASVAAVSFADYRLVNLLGLGGWEPVSWQLMLPARGRFLARDPVTADRGDAGTGALAMDLAACGLAMTFAGESAPLSGLEHVTSHMLDMAAARYGRPVGNHGSQCALATVLTLICYDKLLREVENLALDPDGIDEDAEQRRVRETFTGLDSDGRAWQECWADYRVKLAAWRQHRAAVLAFAENWQSHRADLTDYLTKPEAFVAALAAAGHPLRFDQISSGLDEEQARWAFTGARLMRKRTNVADLLGFAGLWDHNFIDDIFATYHSLIRPYESAATHTATATDPSAKELP